MNNLNQRLIKIINWLFDFIGQTFFPNIAKIFGRLRDYANTTIDVLTETINRIYRITKIFLLVAVIVLGVSLIGVIIGYITYCQVVVSIFGIIAALSCLGIWFVPVAINRIADATILKVPMAEGLLKEAVKIIKDISLFLLNIAFSLSFIAAIAAVFVKISFTILLPIIAILLMLIIISYFKPEKKVIWRNVLLVIAIVGVFVQVYNAAYPLSAKMFASDVSDKVASGTKIIVTANSPIYELKDGNYSQVGMLNIESSGKVIDQKTDPITKEDLYLVSLSVSPDNYIGGRQVLVAKGSTRIPKKEAELKIVVDTVKVNITKTPVVEHSRYIDTVITFKAGKTKVTDIYLESGDKVQYKDVKGCFKVKSSNGSLPEISSDENHHAYANAWFELTGVTNGSVRIIVKPR